MFDFEKECVCTITQTLKQRFCKDTNLSIKVFDEPYFSSMIQLFDKQFGSVSKYKQFVELVGFYGSEQTYLEAYNKLKDDVIGYLNENTAMMYFAQKEDMNQFGCKNQGYPTKDIFKETFDGKVFLSIDMKKGNFTALRHYSPEIVGNKDTYEDFMGLFTDKEYFKNSKYIRQVVFGNVNPKRQVTYEKYLMDKILTEALVSKGFSSDSVVFFSTDELIFEVDNRFVTDGLVTQEYKDIVESLIFWALSENINVRSEIFELRKVPGTTGYVKKFLTGDKPYEFKCMDFLTLPFVLRAYNNEEPQEEDYVFLYEGRKVKLLEEIKVEVV